MKHEVLFLNNKRSYVRVGDVWYDINKEHLPQVGGIFLIGLIEEVLDYETYTATYPESKTEIYYEVNEKTNSGGSIRRVSSRKIGNGEYARVVEYGVNPLQISVAPKRDLEIA